MVSEGFRWLCSFPMRVTFGLCLAMRASKVVIIEVHLFWSHLVHVALFCFVSPLLYRCTTRVCRVYRISQTDYGLLLFDAVAHELQKGDTSCSSNVYSTNKLYTNWPQSHLCLGSTISLFISAISSRLVFKMAAQVVRPQCMMNWIYKPHIYNVGSHLENPPPISTSTS